MYLCIAIYRLNHIIKNFLYKQNGQSNKNARSGNVPCCNESAYSKREGYQVLLANLWNVFDYSFVFFLFLQSFK